jgi:hypothetical protein
MSETLQTSGMPCFESVEALRAGLGAKARFEAIDLIS